MICINIKFFHHFFFHFHFADKKDDDGFFLLPFFFVWFKFHFRCSFFKHPNKRAANSLRPNRKPVSTSQSHARTRTQANMHSDSHHCLFVLPVLSEHGNELNICHWEQPAFGWLGLVVDKYTRESSSSSVYTLLFLSQCSTRKKNN